MQLISKFNKGFRFLLCVIDIYSKYTQVIPLKYKKIQLLILFKTFQINLIANQAKYGQIKAVNFYNGSMKPFLHNNDTEMNGTHNNLSVAPERFIITLKNKIYK